jgi:hypothetical protein
VHDLSPYLVSFLTVAPYQIILWDDTDKINYHCKKHFTLNGYDVSDIKMFQVQYVDVYIQPPVLLREWSGNADAS